ncbi:MAG TPA: O-antigen ligase family protein [Candidatus Hydrogenedentes bacterium]|mgnify:FL=1|nr:O-antigen ligase family protein [Candidatus Hydrogenedentota bacterium]HRT20885.1 O-antigen ligase family protein [Candidatus Hydrogenedentota bacterium]HRT66237.1 O-antigen ligase family protein [Candidatus Hydrogenedentota bacterium]
MTDVGGFELDVRRGIRVLLALGMALVVLLLFPLARDPTEAKYLIAAWTALLAGILFCIGAWNGQTPVRRPSLLTLAVLAFWGFNLFCAVISDHPWNSLNEMRWWTLAIMLYLLAAHAFRKPEEFWAFAAAVCVAVALSSIYGFSQKYGYDPFPWATQNVEEYKRLPATFGNPNFAGHMLALCIPLALALGLQRKYRWCWLPAGIMLAHLYFTHMRGGVLALAGGLAFAGLAYGMARFRMKPARAIVATLAAAVVLGTIGATGLAFYSKARTGHYMPLDGSLLLRYQGYYGSCKMIADRPLFGWGTENYRLENPRYWTPYEQHWYAVQHKMNFHVHNDFLEAGVDAGIPGAALYILFLACGIVYGLAVFFHATESGRRRLGLVLAACFTIFAIDGLFGFNARVPVSRMFIFLLAGALEGTSALRRNKPFLPRPSLWALALLAVASVCAVVEMRYFIGQYLYQQAQGAKRYNRPDIAMDCLTRGRRLIPWSSHFPRELGLLEMMRGQPLRAIPLFEDALARNPCEIQSMVWLGRAYLSRASLMQMRTKPEALDAGEMTKAIDQALDIGRKALDLCIEASETHELMARAYRVRGDWLVRTAPESPDISAASRKIVEHGQQALFYGYARPGEVHRLIASAYEQLGELDEAQKSYRLAVEAAIGDERIWQLFFDFAQSNKRYPAFLRAAEWAMERLGTVNDARASVLASLAIWSAQAYVATDTELDRVQRMIERALKWAPGRLDAWNALAATTTTGDRTARIRARIEKARDDLKAAGKAELIPPLQALLQIWQTNGAALPEATRTIAQACQERGKTIPPQGLGIEFGWMADLCAEALETAALQPPQRSETLVNLGKIFMLIGAWEHADNAFALALPGLRDEPYADCLLKRAEALGFRDKWAEALALARQALQLSPGSFRIHLDAARFFARAGNKDEARKCYAALLQWPNLDNTSRQSLKQEAGALETDETFGQAGKESEP